MTRLCLIAAMAHNRVIGYRNTLPWQLPEDLRHFKATTLGKPVIMGRKTWESLGRALPGRRNIVVSRNPAYTPAGDESVECVASLAAAIALCDEAEAIFVIGGAEIYRQALPLAQRIHLTEIDLTIEGDAYFPEISSAEWKESARESHVGANGLGYAFVVLERVGQPQG